MTDRNDQHGPVRHSGALSRHILRCREGDIDKASTILGLSLPRAACRSASADGLHALWLGPDEWLVLAAGSAAETMLQARQRLAALGGACVDVRHRQVAITPDGPGAENRLGGGCPLAMGKRPSSS